MIDKDIFKALKEAFLVNDVLQHIKLWSFAIEDNLKPFFVFQAEPTGEDTAHVHLVIESEYKGLAELSALKKEIKCTLSISPFEHEGFHYSFREEKKNQKNNVLVFRVKRFKTGV